MLFNIVFDMCLCFQVHHYMLLIIRLHSLVFGYDNF